MIVAAEASGDVLGAGLIRALEATSPDRFEFIGIGGARMNEAGINSPFDISDLSVLGMAEGLKAYGRVKARVTQTLEFAVTHKPDAVVLIDSWGFTLRVAHAIRAAMPDVKLIKYVAPQVWATRPGRARTLARSVDLLLALHHMDAPYFKAEGLKTVVVGNPALNLDFSKADPKALMQEIGLKATDRLILILPGSRPAEIRRLTPVFLEAITQLKAIRSDIVPAVVVSDSVADLLKPLLANSPVPLILLEGECHKLSAMQAADLALACSGTVTTELALAGCPMVIAYKVEPLTYWIFKYLSPLKYVTLFNISAGQEIAPEYIQQACTPQALSEAMLKRLDDETLRLNQRQAQFDALDTMGRGQKLPAQIAAEAIVDFLKS